MERVMVEGVPYITHPVLCYGDYGGAGTVGHANIRYIQEVAKKNEWDIDTCSLNAMSDLSWSQSYEVDKAHWKEIGMPPIIQAWAYPGFEQIFVCEYFKELADELDTLDDYPIFDDEMNSIIEMEWQDLAWDDYVLREFIKFVDEEVQDYIDEYEEQYEEMTNVFRESFNAVYADGNVEWEYGYASAYIDTEKMKERFLQEFERRWEEYLEQRHLKEVAITNQDWNLLPGMEGIYDSIL